MKKFVIVFLFTLFLALESVHAQQSLCFDAGQVFSTFRFSGSTGGKFKDFDSNVGGSYSLDYHFITAKGIFLRGGTGMRRAGATGSFEGLPLTWNLQYLDLSSGAGYIYSKFRFKPYVCAVPYFGYMLKAWQTIGSDNFDLKKDKVLNNLDFGLFLIPGVRVSLNDNIALYSEYKQMVGLANIEKTSGQKLNNRGFVLNLGVAATITKQ